MQAQIQSLVDRWTEAFNAGRTDELAGFYAPDARLVPPGRPFLTGTDALRGFLADIRGQGFHDYRVEIGDTLVKDDVTIASGRWGLTGPGPDGASHRYDGNVLIVLQGAASPGRFLVHMWN